MVGARLLPPEVDTSTSKNPMMGPVQEKLTKASVKAIKKMLNKPVVDDALESTALLHLEGRVISKPPRKEAPNTTNIKKKRMLNTALVDRSLSADAPKMEVIISPSAT